MTDGDLCGNGMPDKGEDCEPADDPGCSQDCTWQTRKVFVTSILFLGNLKSTDEAYNHPQGSESLQLADAHCQQLANQAQLPGQFMAWLSSKNDGAFARLSDLHDFYGRFLSTNDDKIIAIGWKEGLLGAALEYQISYDENGIEVAMPSRAWTNTTSTGEIPLPPLDCSNWMSSDALGIVGKPQSKNQAWSKTQLPQSCNFPAHLYCFQISP